MNNIKLDLGGELRPGDVIGVSYTNSISYGWYVGPGQYGSLQFIILGRPAAVKSVYEAYKAGTTTNKEYYTKRFSKGLLFKHFGKDFINRHNGSRAFKVSNPEEFFKGSTYESLHLESKEILQQVNFPAK